MYNPPDVRWHVLNDTMSQYYLHHYRIFGLNALTLTAVNGRHMGHNLILEIISHKLLCTKVFSVLNYQCVFWPFRRSFFWRQRLRDKWLSCRPRDTVCARREVRTSSNLCNFKHDVGRDVCWVPTGCFWLTYIADTVMTIRRYRVVEWWLFNK